MLVKRCRRRSDTTSEVDLVTEWPQLSLDPPTDFVDGGVGG